MHFLKKAKFIALAYCAIAIISSICLTSCSHYAISAKKASSILPGSTIDYVYGLAKEALVHHATVRLGTHEYGLYSVLVKAGSDRIPYRFVFEDGELKSVHLLTKELAIDEVPSTFKWEPWSWDSTEFVYACTVNNLYSRSVSPEELLSHIRSICREDSKRIPDHNLWPFEMIIPIVWVAVSPMLLYYDYEDRKLRSRINGRNVALGDTPMVVAAKLGAPSHVVDLSSGYQVFVYVHYANLGYPLEIRDNYIAVVMGENGTEAVLSGYLALDWFDKKPACMYYDEESRRDFVVRTKSEILKRQQPPL